MITAQTPITNPTRLKLRIEHLPRSDLVQSMYEFLNFNHKISDPLIITAINRLEMLAYRDAYDRVLSKNKWVASNI